jgi:hypothetical protein
MRDDKEIWRELINNNPESVHESIFLEVLLDIRRLLGEGR